MLATSNRRLTKSYKFLLFSILPNTLYLVLVVLTLPLIFNDILSLTNNWFLAIRIGHDGWMDG